MYPSRRLPWLVVIVLMNADDVDRGAVVQGIADLYLTVAEPVTAR